MFVALVEWKLSRAHIGIHMQHGGSIYLVFSKNILYSKKKKKKKKNAICLSNIYSQS